MLPAEQQQQRESLLEELRQLGEFHRGSVNVLYRKCGKERCACAQKNHPGHGPLVTLTYKEKGKSVTRNLPTMEAVGLGRKLTEHHEQFLDWNRRWLVFNETVAEEHLDQLLMAEPEMEDHRKKKRKRSSGKKSTGRSRP